MATPLAAAFVRIFADTTGFEDDVEDDLRGVGDKAGSAAGQRFGHRMAQEGAVAFGEDGNQFVRVGQQVGDSTGQAAAGAFNSRFWKDANGRWHDERGKFVSEATVMGESAGQGFSDGFDRSQRDGHGRGRTRGAEWGTGFSAGLGGALTRLGSVGLRALEVMLPSLSRLGAGFGSATTAAGGLLSTVGRWSALAAGVAGVGAAAASAAGYTVSLAAALAPVTGLLAALPGAALAGAAAFSVWNLATSGLADAMGAALAGNVEALSAALGKMSERGRAFITEFQQVVPLLRDFQQAAQSAFLDQISGQLERWIGALSGLKPAVRDLSAEFGGLLRTFLDFATAPGSIAQLDGVLRDTHTLVGAVHAALTPLLQGFLDLGAVGSAWLAAMSGGLRDVLVRFGEWMSRIAASGEALAWMDGALKVLRQLGGLIRDVWDIFDGLMDAARSAGGDVLGVLGALVDGFAKWVKSADGQDTLVTVFVALNDIGRALLPIIKALGVAVEAIAPAAADVAVALGPVLAQAIAALGPAVAALGPGLIGLITGIGTAVNAVAPALVPLGGAIASAFGVLQPLLAAIGPAIAALLPGLELFLVSFAQGLALLAPALAPIGAAIGGIAAGLAPLLPLVGQLAALIATSLAAGVQTVLPSLQLLVASLGQALVALMPIVPLVLQLAATFLTAMVPALAPLLPQIASLVTQLVAGLVPALMPLIPIIGQLAGIIGTAFVGVLGQLVGVILQILPPLSQTAVIIGQALLQALQQILPYLPALVGAFLSALPAVAELLPPLAQLAVSLLPRFVNILTTLLPHLPSFITAMIQLTQATYPLIPIFADFLEKLAPHVPLFAEIAAVLAADLLPVLTRFLELVNRVVGGVLTKFTELYDRLVGHSIIPDLVNGISRWISGLPDMFARWFGEARDWAITKFNDLLGWVAGLPGALLRTLGNLGGLLGGVGHDLIIGLWNGMVGMWQWLRDSIYNFFSSIMPQWVKDALGIRSPSRLFAAIGKELPAGLAVGMDVGQPMVKAAADRMAQATVGTFDAPASPAPAFSRTFGAPGQAAGTTAPPRVFQIENLIVQGVLDPTNPVGYRRTVERLREAIRELEKEVYA